MGKKLTRREQALMKIIEGVCKGFLDVYPKEFKNTVKEIDKALAEVGLVREKEKRRKEKNENE